MTLDDLAEYYEKRAAQCSYMSLSMELFKRYGWSHVSATYDLFEWARVTDEADQLAYEIGLVPFDAWITGTAGALLRQARGKP